MYINTLLVQGNNIDLKGFKSP